MSLAISLKMVSERMCGDHRPASYSAGSAPLRDTFLDIKADWLQPCRARLTAATSSLTSTPPLSF